jgi:hypothetical protein
MFVVLIRTSQDKLDQIYPRADKTSVDGTQIRFPTFLYIGSALEIISSTKVAGTAFFQRSNGSNRPPLETYKFCDGNPAWPRQSTVACMHADAFAGHFLLKDKGPTGVLPLEGSTVTIADEGAAGSKHHFAFVLKLAPNYGELAKRDTYVLAAEKYTVLVSRRRCQA